LAYIAGALIFSVFGLAAFRRGRKIEDAAMTWGGTGFNVVPVRGVTDLAVVAPQHCAYRVAVFALEVGHRRHSLLDFVMLLANLPCRELPRGHWQYKNRLDYFGTRKVYK